MMVSGSPLGLHMPGDQRPPCCSAAQSPGPARESDPVTSYSGSHSRLPAIGVRDDTRPTRRTARAHRGSHRSPSASSPASSAAPTTTGPRRIRSRRNRSQTHGPNRFAPIKPHRVVADPPRSLPDRVGERRCNEHIVFLYTWPGVVVDFVSQPDPEPNTLIDRGGHARIGNKPVVADLLHAG